MITAVVVSLPVGNAHRFAASTAVAARSAILHVLAKALTVLADFDRFATPRIRADPTLVRVLGRVPIDCIACFKNTYRVVSRSDASATTQYVPRWIQSTV